MSLPPQVTDLTSFDLLLSVARLGSIGQAAAEHRISQPAASARLRQLERRLGLTLLQRTARGSVLTPTGALIADWARTVVDAADSLAAAVQALRISHESRLTISASQTVAEYLLPAWLVALRARHPDLTVTLQAANSADVAARLLADRADLGFVEGPDLPPGLDADTVAGDRLTVVVAPTHPWARRRRGITPTELATTPLVSREAGSGTLRALESALRQQAIEVLAAPLLELSSTTAIKHAVAAGSGPAVLSSLAVTAELAAGTLTAVPVSGLPLHRQLRAVWPAGRQLTGPARDLHAIARRPR
ncbi:LysR family transcriptional regulator [Micromonospora soli]|uniref:LysR family transcriptional regulator n=1 Tax=Micromonospora sp. NBRC 110009 TaxID=3061627 RepID=UPI0026717874|nr:LysR family transcriptional regulator [Micromonospora sp. NBRC 110009]WKU00313.1 LysR family transcriptional regulator [Micromonospora sp. NBRC 110009]